MRDTFISKSHRYCSGFVQNRNLYREIKRIELLLLWLLARKYLSPIFLCGVQ